MVVMINGSFGVGKTTVANLLHKALPGSVVHDPELAGFVLRRLPSWVRLEGSGTDDYQKIRLWRKSAVVWTRVLLCLAPGPVIVPITFSERAFFDEIVMGVRSFETELRVFCLRASLHTVKSRLLRRGTRIEGAGSEWIMRRVAECAAAHRDPHFGEPVETDDRPPSEVAREIIEKLRPARPGG